MSLKSDDQLEVEHTRRPAGCAVTAFGVLLMMPLVLMLILAAFGLVMSLSPAAPGETAHFNFRNLGALTINSEAVAPGWLMQLASLLSAIAGASLMRGRNSKSSDRRRSHSA